MIKKLWFKSRTVILLLVGIAAIAIQIPVGVQLVPLEYQTLALLISSLVLRFVTTEGVTLPSTTDVGPILTELLRLLRIRKQVV